MLESRECQVATLPLLQNRIGKNNVAYNNS